MGAIRTASPQDVPGRLTPDPHHTTWAGSADAQRRLHRLVPGGAHTYARGSDQYPEGVAPVLVRGVGARVRDVDGNWYVEYGMGLRSVTLGHGYRPVVDAVARAAADGTSFSRPSVLELDAAERFLATVPGADMVKFAKNGSDATTAALRLARAATGRDVVAICRSQPFFSVDDWFISTTGMDAGIPGTGRDLTVGFAYNDLDSLRRVLEEHRGQVAAVFLEAATGGAEPAPGFLEGVRALTTEHGAVMVLDEMITGMRWHAGGAQHVYDVTPDLSTWGKALGNGFAVSALAGRRELMELGGLDTAEPRVFLLSTTHGPETTGLAAYLAVADAYAEHDVVGIMERQGERLRRGVQEVTAAAGVADHVTVGGRASCLVFGTLDPQGAPSQAYRALFLQELLRHGVLGQSFVISAAHTDDDVDLTVEAVARACVVYAKALDAGTTDGYLRGRPVAPALRPTAAPRRLPDLGAPTEEVQP
ncbi:glutamate-1-semialdehyde 2,1-aminomutase [Isoptericola jiangsuensis]|uniref:Glutamate-1-semialdehyde 2,1-aminomutase n=1 Tax=Isoptericola jiangsuensis TaxID=548579 RepID=A0A2A9F145_9MICO|nr:glutamate-1-semialdehyde 2,1-aminomutase [Isoptericola jiangsuensis]PFG44220.1 glutamate-1-semialdehyde 2,1-aminomutase [Isoptericola jiangsuensis]